MAVFVLGKLGDAYRKLCELELLKEKQPTNKLLDTDIKAFETAIEGWPLKDPSKDQGDVRVQYINLKIQMSHLQTIEQDLIIELTTRSEEHTDINKAALEMQSSLNRLKLVSSQYLAAVQECRKIVGNINALGSMGILSFADQAKT